MLATLSILAGSLAAAAASSPQATVYISPAPGASDQTPLLSPAHANSVLSGQLGLGAFEESAPGHERWAHLIESGKQAWEDQGVLFVWVDGIEDAEGLVPSNLSPAFHISSPPSTPAWVSLLDTYTTRARTVFSSSVTNFGWFSSSLASFIESASDAFHPLLNALDVHPSEAFANLKDELADLVAYVDNFANAQKPEGVDAEDTSFATLRFHGLGQVEQEYGRKSSQWKDAKESFRSLLEKAAIPSFQQACESRDLVPKIVLLVTPPSSSSHSKRQDAFSLTSPALSTAPVFSSSECLTSAEACANATDSCSGRGQCVETRRAGRACFTCACEATKTEDGKATTQWAGVACERKDVSSEFTLLLGSTVFLIVIAVASVALLASAGSAPLPNTLLGGPVSRHD